MSDTDKLTDKNLRNILVDFALTDRAAVIDNRDKFDRQENLNKTNGAILDLFKSLVPEEIYQPQFPWKHANEHMDHWKVAGFNKCRSQLLAKIESLRK